MSTESVNTESSKEEVILRTVKTILTDVIRETAVEPGRIHPLTTTTREEIRRCFILITERERELAALAGRSPAQHRPRFKDDTVLGKEVIIPVAAIQRAHSDHEG